MSTKKDSTLRTWTQIALTAGPRRKLIVAQDDRWGYMAILDFGASDERVGGRGETLELALEELEKALMEDAADEMMKSGAV